MNGQGLPRWRENLLLLHSGVGLQDSRDSHVGATGTLWNATARRRRSTPSTAGWTAATVHDAGQGNPGDGALRRRVRDPGLHGQRQADGRGQVHDQALRGPVLAVPAAVGAQQVNTLGYVAPTGVGTGWASTEIAGNLASVSIYHAIQLSTGARTSAGGTPA